MKNQPQQREQQASVQLSELLQEVEKSIKAVHPGSKIILFGSYARGDIDVDSDLDLCVLVSELTKRRVDMNAELRSAVRNTFYRYELPFDIKIYTFSEFERDSVCRSTLPHTINAEGVVFGD